LVLVLEELVQRDPGLVQIALQQFSPESQAPLAIRGPKDRPDLRSGARRRRDVEPVLRRLLARRGHDFDDIAALQFVTERLELPVHARAGDVVSELGVNGVREIDRRRAAWKDANVALRGEDADLVLEEIDLHALEELGRILELALPLHQLTEPPEFLRVRVADSPAPLLVLPVRRDAAFGDAMHLVRADLDLDALAARADHRRVERLVHVRLGER